MPPNGDDKEVILGGTLIPWNSHAVLLEHGRLAVAVVGLSDVEVLDVDMDGVRSTVVGAPALPTTSSCSSRAPMAVAAADVDGLGTTDLIIQDSCGSWVAESQEDGRWVSKLNSLIDEAGASLYMEAFDAAKFVALANTDRLTVLSLAERVATELTLPGASPSLKTAKLLVPLATNPPSLVVQRRTGLAIITALDNGPLATESSAVLHQMYGAPYVRPFDVYAHLVDVTRAECAPMVLGVGAFQPEAGAIPRGLQSILLDVNVVASGGYVATDFDEPLDILGMAVAEAPKSSGFIQILGVLHRLDSRHLFSVFGRIDCLKWAEIETRAVDFDIRTPPSPSWGAVDHVPVTPYVNLLASLRADGSGVDFYHYDGFDVRVLRFDAFTQTILQRIVHVHTERDDLSFR